MLAMVELRPSAPTTSGRMQLRILSSHPFTRTPVTRSPAVKQADDPRLLTRIDAGREGRRFCSAGSSFERRGDRESSSLPSRSDLHVAIVDLEPKRAVARREVAHDVAQA